MKMKNGYFGSLLTAVIAMVSVGVSEPAFANKKETAVLESYLKIQEALASDSLGGVAAAARAIEKSAKNVEIKAAAKKLSSAKTLEAAREHFKELSVPMDLWAKKERPAGVERVSCSMAKATWLQKRGAVKNPYYGKEMSGCGEVETD